MEARWVRRTFHAIGAVLCTLPALSQSISTVPVEEIGRYQHPYSFGTISASTYSCRIDRMDRPYVYMACWNLGLVTLDISDPAHPAPVDTLSPAMLGGLNAMHVEQRDDVLYVALGGFDDDAQGTGLATVDVSDPTHLSVLDRWDGGEAFTTGAAIVLLHHDLAFVGGMEEGVVALNVADPAAIGFVGSYLPDPAWPGLVSYAPNARGMAIRNDVLFLCFDAGALRAIDIQDPAHMTELGRYLNPQQPLFTPCAYNNVMIHGDRAFITTDYCGFETVDISDPAHMVQVHWENPWNCAGASWFGSDGHTNEAALALGDSLLFLSAGDSELLIYEVSDPGAPRPVGGHAVPNDTAAAWGVDVHRDLAAVCLLNNSFIVFPPQPYISRFGGLVLYRWHADHSTGIAADVARGGAPYLVYDMATDRLLVERSTPGDLPGEVRVVDAQGRVVLRTPLTSAGRTEIDLSHVSAGPYTALLESDGKRRILKFVRAR